MWRDHDAPGGYMPPWRTDLSSCSAIVEIDGYRAYAIVWYFVVMCFGTLVAVMDVTASEVDTIPITALSHLGGGQSECSEWLQQVSRWAGLRALPMRVHKRTVAFFGKIRILYKCPVFAGRTSLDTTPVTGSLLFAAPGCRLTDFSAGGIVLRVSRDSAGLLLAGVCRVLRIVLRIYYMTEKVMGSNSPADGRSGVDFNVPWNAPEAYVNLDSDGVYELKTVPDVLGLHACRRPGAAVVKVLLWRDSRSV